MKNLENFGVQELNSLESKEIDGGIIFAINALAGLIVYGAFMAGYNAGAAA